MPINAESEIVLYLPKGEIDTSNLLQGWSTITCITNIHGDVKVQRSR